MSDTRATVQVPSWLGAAILTLLTLQLGLIYVQGMLLQRQHGDLQGLREDVQYLAEALDQGEEAGEADPGEAGLQPVRHRPRRSRPARAVRAAYLQDAEADGEKAVKKDLEDVRKSEREAVAKARDTREKLSISENIRKADEKARLEAEGRRWRPWLWAAGGLAVAAMFLRSWLRGRG